MRKFVMDEYLQGEDPSTLTGETHLLSTGILDSVGTLKLITFLEDEFEIQVEPHEADEAHLDTIADICELVRSKL